jgi:hypothetical protein
LTHRSTSIHGTAFFITASWAQETIAALEERHRREAAAVRDEAAAQVARVHQEVRGSHMGSDSTKRTVY